MGKKYPLASSSYKTLIEEHDQSFSSRLLILSRALPGESIGDVKRTRWESARLAGTLRERKKEQNRQRRGRGSFYVADASSQSSFRNTVLVAENKSQASQGRKMRIGCLQFAPQVGDVNNNLNRADSVLNRADPEDLDLLVLPELAFTGTWLVPTAPFPFLFFLFVRTGLSCPGMGGCKTRLSGPAERGAEGLKNRHDQQAESGLHNVYCVRGAYYLVLLFCLFSFAI